MAVWGGSLIVAAYRALRHPPPPTGLSLRVLHALPAGLTALALLVLLMLVRDALWRGPVTVPGATVDWLLGTPVDRRRLLRPRFRLSASGAIAAGAAVGIVPAAALVALGLGGRDGGDVLRLTGTGLLSAALLFAAGTGLAGLIERHPASWPWVRRATPVAVAAAALLGGIAAWAAFGTLPAVVNTVLLWSGPWGWAAQGLTALAGHGALPALGVGVRGPGLYWCCRSASRAALRRCGRWLPRCSPRWRWPRWPPGSGPRPGCPRPRSGPGPAPWARCPRPR